MLCCAVLCYAVPCYAGQDFFDEVHSKLRAGKPGFHRKSYVVRENHFHNIPGGQVRAAALCLQSLFRAHRAVFIEGGQDARRVCFRRLTGPVVGCCKHSQPDTTQFRVTFGLSAVPHLISMHCSY